MFSSMYAARWTGYSLFPQVSLHIHVIQFQCSAPHSFCSFYLIPICVWDYQRYIIIIKILFMVETFLSQFKLLGFKPLDLLSMTHLISNVTIIIYHYLFHIWLQVWHYYNTLLFDIVWVLMVLVQLFFTPNYPACLSVCLYCHLTTAVFLSWRKTA